MRCRFCGDRMTSAPSHMEHENECSMNPAVMVKTLAPANKALRRLLKAARVYVDEAMTDARYGGMDPNAATRLLKRIDAALKGAKAK